MTALFNTPRAGRQNRHYMEQLIVNMWNASHSVFKQGYGLFAVNAANIINAFQAVQNTYQKANRVKVHYMEIYVEKEKGQEDVIRVADCMGKYFFQLGFQSFISVVREGEIYLIAIAVNAVSFAGQAVFHDNNFNYTHVFTFLCSIAPYDWRVTASDHTFFDPKTGEGNYVHGKFA